MSLLSWARARGETEFRKRLVQVSATRKPHAASALSRGLAAPILTIANRPWPYHHSQASCGGRASGAFWPGKMSVEKTGVVVIGMDVSRPPAS